MKLQHGGLGLSVKYKNLLGSCSPMDSPADVAVVSANNECFVDSYCPPAYSSHCAWMKLRELVS